MLRILFRILVLVMCLAVMVPLMTGCGKKADGGTQKPAAGVSLENLPPPSAGTTTPSTTETTPSSPK